MRSVHQKEAKKTAKGSFPDVSNFRTEPAASYSQTTAPWHEVSCVFNRIWLLLHGLCSFIFFTFMLTFIFLQGSPWELINRIVKWREILTWPLPIATLQTSAGGNQASHDPQSLGEPGHFPCCVLDEHPHLTFLGQEWLLTSNLTLWNISNLKNGLSSIYYLKE